MTAARATDGWSVNVRAARTVALHATSRTEARHLLDVLGLVDEDGRIVPDDTKWYRLGPLAAGKGEGVEPLTRRDKGAQPPPGLATLAPVAEQPRPRPRRRAPAVTPARKREPRPRPDRASSRRRVSRCGTNSGYAKHRAAKETPCEPCMVAHRAYQRAYDARRAAANRPPGWEPRRAKCGTTSGYEKHRKKGEVACRPCKDAQAAATRARYHRRHPNAETYSDRRPAQCGTTAGYSAHKRRKETPCRSCKDAHNAYLRRRYARLKGTP